MRKDLKEHMMKCRDVKCEICAFATARNSLRETPHPPPPTPRNDVLPSI